jgi:hypothetical protein
MDKNPLSKMVRENLNKSMESVFSVYKTGESRYG